MAKGKRSRPDHYTDRAKKAGFAARSVYKLEEIDKKYRLIKPGLKILDIGAAPGSWSQYVLKKGGKSVHLTAVDLQDMHLETDTYSDVAVIKDDVFSAKMADILEERGPFHLIISDAAPATTGNRSVDTARSAALVEGILHLATQRLVPGGNLVAKLFQGGDEKSILDAMRMHFQSAKAFKPKASRSESFETFLIGVGKKDVQTNEETEEYTYS